MGSHATPSCYFGRSPPVSPAQPPPSTTSSLHQRAARCAAHHPYTRDLPVEKSVEGQLGSHFPPPSDRPWGMLFLILPPLLLSHTMKHFSSALFRGLLNRNPL